MTFAMRPPAQGRIAGMPAAARRVARTASRRRGSAMVAILVALMALQMVVAVLVLSGARSDDLSSRSIAGLRAQYASDAALNMALREAFVNVDEDGDGTIGGISGDALASNDPTIGAARASVSATVVGNDRTISVGARSDEARRSASAIVRTTTISPTGPRRGLRCEGWASASMLVAISLFNWNSTPTVTGWVPQVNMPGASGIAHWAGGQPNRIALRMTGRITIPATGTWTFGIGSDDGADVWINGTRVAFYEGLHGFAVTSGNIALNAGTYDIVVRYFNNGGGDGLTLAWTGPTVPSSTLVPSSAFSHDSSGHAHVAIQNTITITGDNTPTGASIDAFNSGNGPYSSGSALSTGALVAINSATSSAWQMSDQAILRGNAGVAPGANPSSVITTSSGSSITGSRTAQASLHGVFHATAPTLASSGAFNATGTHALATNRRYTSFQLSGSSSVFTVTGDVTMVVDGNLQLTDGARIVVSPGSILLLYAENDMVVSETSHFNADGAPDQAFIFMTGTTSTFTMANQAQVVAHLHGWGTQASISGTGSGSDFSGTLRATSLSLSGKARIHADINAVGGTGVPTRRVTSVADGPLF
jgi:hypothetical protein